MAETARGKLVWQSSGKERVRRVVFPTRKGMSQPTFFPPDQIAEELRSTTEDEIDVELELEQGKPTHIRPVGAAWTGAATPVRRPESQGGQRGGGRGASGRQRDFGRGGGGRDRGSRERTDRGPGPEREPGFHNPYNFIPAVPPAAAHDVLGQHAPCGHDRYHKDRWSGRIDIRITTETPLLIPDAARATTYRDERGHPIKGHLLLGVRKYREAGEDRPYLPPTSLKGALRSAYEAVTNSRMAVFKGHDVPLAHRMEARTGLAMIPARLSNNGTALELWPGTSSLPARRGEPMSAAWLPRYRRGAPGLAPWAVKYHNSSTLPEHGDEVVCWLELFRHARRGFTYWRVRSIAPVTLGASLPKPEPSDRALGAHEPVRGQALLRAQGWVCITNQNINSKHDERVFFVPHGSRPTPATGADVGKLHDYWKNLVTNYQVIHAGDLEKRKEAGRKPWDYLGGEPGKTAWSRHVYEKDVQTLERGDLCYALRDAGGSIIGLYPVMISRELAAAAPLDLLPDVLQPARRAERKGQTKQERRAAAEENKKHAVRFEQLSPADRVFGWINEKGGGAWRGQLRIGPVRCTTKSSEAIEDFGKDGLPLAILSTAKPQQARFYVAKNQAGDPQDRGLSKADATYADDGRKTLRGRKVFPHHRPASVIDGYWDRERALADSAPKADALQANGRSYFREYRRRPESTDGSPRDDQNRSIKEWVKPGTIFTTWIDVINLSREELGALLWLLSLDAFEQNNAGHFHRLGGGKPLGFGSVKIKITGLDLADGEGKKAEYQKLVPVEKGERTEPHFAFAENEQDAIGRSVGLVDDYKKAIEMAYPDGGGRSGFAAVSFISAFLRAVRGFDDDLPGHYPRADRVPDPKGENYKWFVANEQIGRDAPQGNRVALGELAGDRGLPYWK